jgi:DNA-binding IclR family transcriptional regulator
MLSNRVEDLPPSKKATYKQVVTALEAGPQMCKHLSTQVGIPVPTLSRILVDLEGAGILAATPPQSRTPRIWRIEDLARAKVLD